MAPTRLDGIDAVRAAVGTHLGYSDWLTIEQHRVDRFAEATGDFQWIHVDQERAAQGPFGGTIAHGYLTISLLPVLMGEVVTFDGLAMAMNYGNNKVRFTAPVRVGSRIRGGFELTDLTQTGPGMHLASFQSIIEIEGSERPACVAQTLALLVTGQED